MNFLRPLLDRFTLALLATVAVASLLPCSGSGAALFDGLAKLAVGLLFFLHGARLSRSAIIAGASHWRLHLLVFACTFALFPLLGLALQPLLGPWLGAELYVGMLYLCALPGTVQSAIAFTSMARGNLPAAVCSASASSILGIFLTPLLVSLLLGAETAAGSPLQAIGRILVQLLLPFLAGHLSRPWLADWLDRRRAWLKVVDQGSILLVVYTAFSAAVVEGLWRAVPLPSLLILVVACCLLLALALLATTLLSRRLGFATEDEIAIVFCGSKKSLVAGVPMAQVLFAGGTAGAALLPLMLFHQIQLMVCAVLAQRYARRAGAPAH
ncbi:MAG TPA: bile acid:sodium symporter family protein [Pseudomonas sp.]|nr:bile acid:sodium symporter family protein [Pseudomonas sp.]